jgi:hypothetical protein
MARCAYCGTETELFEGPTPVCIHCADVAADAFVTATSDIPSGIPHIPHPDGVQRIHNASHEMTAARNELIKGR